MPSSDTPGGNDVSPEPSTPHTAPAAAKKGKDGKNDSDPVTPSKKPAVASPGDAPKSAPAAAHHRHRSSSKKHAEPPTLLTDFLRGRPSPARLAAERERRKSLDAVKAELRLEMRQNAVRRVQPPGGVRDRVKAWQKSNAASGDGSPDDAATEPTDVAFDGEEMESVTEEDRVRIKMRQKRKNPLKAKPSVLQPDGAFSNSSKPSNDTDVSGGKPVPHPKKRVVSDTNWMRPKVHKPPQRRVSPRTRRSSPTSGGAQIPKDFTLRTAPNPGVSNRVKEWAAKVDAPSTASTASTAPGSHRSSKSRERSVLSDGTETDVGSEGAQSSSQITARQSLRPRRPGSESSDGVHGIRVKATRRKTDTQSSLVKPSPTAPSPDGNAAGDTAHPPQPADSARHRSRTLPSRPPVSRTTPTKPPRTMDGMPAESGSDVDTPTKRGSQRPRPHAKERSKSFHAGLRKTRDDASWIEDGASNINGSQLLGSDLASSLANKSIADLPGEVPFGNSAFTELDLPLDGPARSRPKRPKAEPGAGIKSMPSVFKKVMEEGKKMISEMNDPPRQLPPPNKPASIEKWLSNTVDPFVDSPRTEAGPSSKVAGDARSDGTPDRARSRTREPAETPKVESEEKNAPEAVGRASRDERSRDERSKERMHRRSSHDARGSQSSQPRTDTALGPGTPSTPPKANQTTPRSDSAPRTKTSDSGGLKRRSAVRTTSSPSKPAEKPQFLDFFREAFHGESADIRGHSSGRHSQEQRRHEDGTADRRAPTGYDSRPTDSYDEPQPGPEPGSSPSAEAAAQKMAGPRFRPPTSGSHELSTIMSEEGSSAAESDLASDISRSTLTQSTALTKDSDLSRSRSKRQEPGLKRRLTKHSDLVSVLSYPDDGSIPQTIKSTRSRPSQRRARGHADRVSATELLKEFSDDEGLYMRELKTLVDGVVPVLLSQVVQGGSTADLFGAEAAGHRLDSLSKSVVGMGVALEKLRSAHRKAPHHDIRRLAHWAHGTVPMYNSYLNSWRLGFKDLVVNLAPAAERPDDEDSLINAMPRNEKGDIVNENGERVDVAHLLKRPLIRIKHLVKLIECLDSMIASDDTRELLKNFRDLQEKARRRHREEAARLTDEEAINTDTTRTRDLRTLGALDSVAIDPRRQVNAKDVFSLDLAHSNGQRLECQVELVQRDNQRDSGDPGDLLIRETGEGNRAYLLFAPIPVSSLSARTGEANSDMVIMVRGAHHGRAWHELLTLSSDNEDQILDWLDILPLTPVPPREPEPSVVDDDEYAASPRPVDIPVGARSIRRRAARTSGEAQPSPPQSPSTPQRSPPRRYHPRGSGLPTTPPRIDEEEEPQERTPTQRDYLPSQDPERSRPLRASMRPDPATLASSDPSRRPVREDGAPPPPIHRTLGGERQPDQGAPSTPKTSIKPPVELKSDGKVKRRTSSPLKHEYLPSDGSSASGFSGGSGSDPEDSDSDDDEIESIDLPETEVGFSIKEDEPREGGRRRGTERDAEMDEVLAARAAAESALTASECSLTPSNSASQAGLGGPKVEDGENVSRYMATVSRWSDRGAWKELTTEPCFVIVAPGLIEAHRIQASGGGQDQRASRPLLAMDLTPLVLIRQSTTVDLEIRSSLQPHCKLSESCGGGNFRFRCNNGPDCFSLYMSVHHARLNNQKFIQLENEARFRSFGERPAAAGGDADASSRRRTWFGRKNSYRSSVRGSSQHHNQQQQQQQSQDGASSTPSSNVSASSFLKRLTVAGNLTFNLARSSVDKQSRPSSMRNSLYTSGSSSAGGTPPRSPSTPSVGVDGGGGGHMGMQLNSGENMRVRLHLLVAASKWEDFGNCVLQVRRPPPGWHQALRADHGLEKRVTVTTMPRRESDKARILLDAVLGSACFSPMGSRGIVCGVWEEVRDGDGVVGSAPATGPTGGNIKKWCFQFANAAEMNWVLRLVHQEVLRA